MSKPKLDLRYILVESFFIVLTVTLALVLNQWRENIKEENKKEEVLQNIKKEIQENVKSLENSRDYHKEMSERIIGFINADTARQFLEGKNGAGVIVKLLDKGISPSLLQKSAWRSAEITGIASTFDFETIYQLSSLYDLQESGVSNTWKMLAVQFTDLSSYKESETFSVVNIFAMGFRELYTQENYLIYESKRAIELLESKGI